MSEQFNVTVNLSTTVCPSCGVIFAIPCHLMDIRRQTHKAVYCPNGHTFNWPGKTDEQKRIEQLEGAFDEMDGMYEQEKEENRKARNKIAYLKRKVKK